MNKLLKTKTIAEQDIYLDLDLSKISHIIKGDNNETEIYFMSGDYIVIKEKFDRIAKLLNF